MYSADRVTPRAHRQPAERAGRGCHLRTCAKPEPAPAQNATESSLFEAPGGSV